MTQQPFSRPGAIDLSALKRPTPTAAGPSGPAGGSSAGVAGGWAYAVDVTEANFQSVVEASATAPVLLVCFSATRMLESVQLADDLTTLSDEFDGRFLVGRVDVDSTPSIAQALQLESIPFVYAVLDGRPAPLLQDVVPLAELRTMLTQVMQSLAGQGMTARHQPMGPVDPPAEQEPGPDPRYAPAQDALEAGDYEQAVAEYQTLLSAMPSDAEAAAGLAMARVLLRTRDVDDAAARAAADGAPDDVDAQSLVADLDLLAGSVEAAFTRLVELVRRTAGDDRTAARDHLVGLFAAVGNDDALVLQGRRQLANALF